MAASFVPVLFYAGGAAAFRSWIDRASPLLTSSAQRTSRVKAAGSCSVATKDDNGGVVKGSAPAREGDSWVEIPITFTLLGYETREERAKFTVYKILVIGGKGDSWVIFRRYTDFCRLSNKLKELFPAFQLGLPPKRWFKDNYNGEFLEDRQVGLQAFLQNLMNHKDIISSEAVRHFLCLVHPPSPFDTLEESRAFCETLEETNHHLQRELLEKQGELGVLKKNLEEREKRIGLLLKKVKALQPGNFEDPPGLLGTLLTSVNGEENPQKHTELLNGRMDDGKAWRNKSSEPRSWGTTIPCKRSRKSTE